MITSLIWASVRWNESTCFPRSVEFGKTRSIDPGQKWRLRLVKEAEGGRPTGRRKSCILTEGKNPSIV
jgi:hypothetical protein